MNPPRRWLDDPKGAPDGAADLLRGVRRTRGLPDAVYARTAARVAGLSVSSAGASAAAAWLKPLAGLIAVGLAGVVASSSLHPAAHTSFERASSGFAAHVAPAQVAVPSASVPLVEPVAPVPLSPSTEEAPQAQAVVAPIAPPVPAAVPLQSHPRPVPSVSVHRIAQSTPVQVPSDTQSEPAAAQSPGLPAAMAGGGYVAPSARAEDPLIRENALLGQVRDVLASDPAEALRRLDAYDSACPNHILGDQRDVLAVQALLRVGRAEDARARGESSLRRYPDGLYSQYLRRLIVSASALRPAP